MSVISIDNVYFEYDTRGGGTQKALSGVSLEVEEGEFIALLGHNGSGKSTLAKLLNGLIVPTSGEVRVYGYSTLDDEHLYEIRKRVGMVFQNPDNQMVASIVEDDIAFGPENLGVEREEIGRRVEFALNAVGMQEYRHTTPFKMSGGQKQRIAIAAVLAMRPGVLVLDESTAMLDPKGRKEVLGVVKKLNREEGITVILITHYMEEAVDASRVVVLGEGKILASGTPAQIFADREMIERAKLKLPVAADLARRLRELGVEIGASVLDEASLTEELCRLL